MRLTDSWILVGLISLSTAAWAGGSDVTEQAALRDAADQLQARWRACHQWRSVDGRQAFSLEVRPDCEAGPELSAIVDAWESARGLDPGSRDGAYSLLRLAGLYRQVRDVGAARRTLQLVVDEHPSRVEAVRAREALAQLAEQQGAPRAEVVGLLDQALAELAQVSPAWWARPDPSTVVQERRRLQRHRARAGLVGTGPVAPRAESPSGQEAPPSQPVAAVPSAVGSRATLVTLRPFFLALGSALFAAGAARSTLAWHRIVAGLGLVACLALVVWPGPVVDHAQPLNRPVAALGRTFAAEVPKPTGVGPVEFAPDRGDAATGDPGDAGEVGQRPEHAPVAITDHVVIFEDYGSTRKDLEVWEGFAAVGHPVRFALRWADHDDHPRQDGHDVSVRWSFGDGTWGSGTTPSHSYLAGSGGENRVTVWVFCEWEGDLVFTAADEVTVYVIEDLEITTIGVDPAAVENRLAFNIFAIGSGQALPATLPADAHELLDWDTRVDGADMVERDESRFDFHLPEAEWPASNAGWGPTQLTLSVNMIAGANQQPQCELLHGCDQGLVVHKDVLAFYDANGSENPTADPNWFYYYKDYEGGSDYVYSASRTTSNTAENMFGVNSIEIAKNAYLGNFCTPVVAGGGLGSAVWSLQGLQPRYQYLKYFMGAVAHEREHSIQYDSYIYAHGNADRDISGDIYEISVSLTDPTISHSAAGPLILPGGDSEYYAGGVVECFHIGTETGTQDWAFPGTQW